MYISLCCEAAAGESDPMSQSESSRNDPMTTFPSLESYVEWCEANGVEVDPAVIETCLQRMMEEPC